MVQALDDHNRRDRVFENQLLLIVRLKNKGVLIETLNATREFNSTQKVDGYYPFFLARII